MRLSGEEEGSGPAVVLLHGLTATRRYVTHGSRALPRAGYRAISYDARGHGESGAPSDESAYEYANLADDLGALLDDMGIERAVLAGHSMGAATAIRFAIDHPDRVEAMVQITPAYDGARTGADLEYWKRLADGLDTEGVDGFMAAYEKDVRGEFRDTVLKFTRQRLERHADPHAVACALRVTPASVAFDGLEVLRDVDVPTLVIGSRDEADPGHPLAVSKAYAERLPDAELIIEDEGKSPIAWQGSQVSKAIAEFLVRRQIT